MIRFSLRCEPEKHAFEGWFRSNEDFDRQANGGLVSCPVCGSTDVSKGLMKPALGGTSEAAAPAQPDAANVEAAAKALARLQEIAREVRAKGDYVGPKFAEEARKIHYGESESRQIYGEASASEVKGLSEEGIAALPLPPLPEDRN